MVLFSASLNTAVKLVLFIWAQFPVTESSFSPSVSLGKFALSGRKTPTSRGCKMFIVCGGNNRIWMFSFLVKEIDSKNRCVVLVQCDPCPSRTSSVSLR